MTMPKRIWAYIDSGWGERWKGQWQNWPVGDDVIAIEHKVTPFVRADVADALAEALRGARGVIVGLNSLVPYRHASDAPLATIDAALAAYEDQT